MDIVYCIGI